MISKGIDIPDLWLEKIIPHPVQKRLVEDQVRFKVVPAGRRSGKSMYAKRELVKAAMSVPGMYFAAAPTYGQAKKLFWKDIGLYIPKWFHERKPSISEMIYFLKNGSEIHVIGVDNPARIEGPPWTGGVIDEIADCKPETWYEHIRPAFDTIGLDTWCWLIGVPEGFNFYYDLAEYARTSGDDEWGFYTWKSSEILSTKAVDAAKRSLSTIQYNQEYEAAFITATGRIYMDYGDDNHTTAELDKTLDHIIFTHDFNFTPLSSAILQVDRNGRINVVGEILLKSAVAKQTAFEFAEKYRDFKHLQVRIYGDASGHIGEKHGQTSNYMEIQKILQQEGFNVRMRVPRYNGSIVDSQNSLRAKIMNAAGERSFFVNPKVCPNIDKALKTVTLKSGSAFQEEDSDLQHITTALRYYTSVEFPVNRNRPKMVSTNI